MSGDGGHERPLGAVRTEVGITDDRVAMSADVDATVRVSSRRLQPLGGSETHATLTVSGDGVRVSLELDAPALDALAADVADARRAMGLAGDAADDAEGGQ
jgi:hypothetical protein